MQLVRKQYGEIVRDREAEEFAEAMGGVKTGYTPRVREIEQAKDEKKEDMSPVMSPVMSEVMSPPDCGGKENLRHALQAFSSVESEVFDMDDIDVRHLLLLHDPVISASSSLAFASFSSSMLRRSPHLPLPIPQRSHIS